MSDSRMPGDEQIANRTDFCEVSICFEDPTINLLFSELLEVRGIRTHILESIEHFSGSSKLVTEPQYYSSLASDQRQRCLIVGNKDALRELKDGVPLSRPLTEDKIEEAIRQFLRS
jgi:hypothetical protein